MKNLLVALIMAGMFCFAVVGCGDKVTSKSTGVTKATGGTGGEKMEKMEGEKK